MADLIFSRAHNNAELTLADIAQRAPAALAASPADSVSDRYQHVSTIDAIEVLSDSGWVPVQAAQKKARTGSPEHAQHLVSFAPRDGLADYSESRPEIILYNSHDAKSALKLFAGVFRFICSNGIVAGEGFQSRVRHTGESALEFESMLHGVVQSLPQMMDSIQRMRSQTLTQVQALELAANVAALRWNDPRGVSYDPNGENPDLRGSYFGKATLEQMVTPQRYEDSKPDAWSVFNRIQESAIRGGAPVISFTDKNPRGTYRRSRPIASVSESVRVNRGAWDCVESILEAA